MTIDSCFDIRKRDDGDWEWRAYAADGSLLAQGGGFKNREAAEKDALDVLENLPGHSAPDESVYGVAYQPSWTP